MLQLILRSIFTENQMMWQFCWKGEFRWQEIITWMVTWIVNIPESIAWMGERLWMNHLNSRRELWTKEAIYDLKIKKKLHISKIDGFFLANHEYKLSLIRRNYNIQCRKCFFFWKLIIFGLFLFTIYLFISKYFFSNKHKLILLDIYSPSRKIPLNLFL